MFLWVGKWFVCVCIYVLSFDFANVNTFLKFDFEKLWS